MTLWMAMTSLWMGCQTAPATRTTAEQDIASVRSQKSYTTTFKAEIDVPGSDTLVIEGRNVWINPGVLYVHYRYTGSGGSEKWILRVGS